MPPCTVLPAAADSFIKRPTNLTNKQPRRGSLGARLIGDILRMCFVFLRPVTCYSERAAPAVGDGGFCGAYADGDEEIFQVYGLVR